MIVGEGMGLTGRLSQKDGLLAGLRGSSLIDLVACGASDHR